MYSPQILLLSLAATSVSAIDGYFHLGGNCDGPATVCRNMNPGFCCTVGGANTIGYRGIPTDWTISAEGRSGGGCSNFGVRRTASNTNFLCLSPAPGGGPFTGTRYEFGSKKRDLSSLTCPGAENTAAAGAKACVATQKAEELILADGTRYKIGALEEDVVNEMVRHHLPIVHKYQ
ncbi:uncharacterized protein PG998_002324 [Apiospora kogelbergensis]|uniref:Uncharacterized protein n=1 Tax=Apiospora kogelbergensis TaxID=1337665 RepID=A0AAW0Q654_9PEZI